MAHNIGDKVYFDSFGGLIPCKVIGIGQDSYGNRVSISLKVTMRSARGGSKPR